VLRPLHQKLYNDLMALCSTEDSSFYFKDHIKDDQIYRIFVYRIASYSDFLKEGALECRGTMFRMFHDKQAEEVNPTELVCRPPLKFFNLDENPFTQNLDHAGAIEFMDKADGSLISTFMHNEKLALKTKASLTAEQIELAWSVLRAADKDLLSDITYLTKHYYTINMEIVSPLNRIVLPYDKTELRILNIRNNDTGETSYFRDISGYPSLQAIWVDREEIQSGDEERFIKSIAMMEDIEGFVVRYYDGKLVKIKTDWYKTLHHTKDSVNIPRRLFECVVTETTDDLRSLFHDDPIALQKITDMEAMVVPKINHMIHVVENFYAANKEKSRKDYAILGTKTLGEYFSLAMTLYLKETGLKTEGPDYKAYAIKNYKSFGVPDEETVEND
jgi:T4 RnlA family RNA ligase